MNFNNGIPRDIIKEYNVIELVVDGWVRIKIQKK